MRSGSGWFARANNTASRYRNPIRPITFDAMPRPEGRAYHDIRVSHEQMLRGSQHGGHAIRVYSVLFEGRLAATDAVRFRKALGTGIGHGKVMGLGLLSVVPSPL
ncbi:MAG: type I-E CRISPR-associated protein Cas6/Cse3/CasE [Xanthomonadaceae bacterium]|nr:type I-E CRISPR-associated protein Cas6/Cse3/CasE [Xanthomonadaceae bacterium]MDE3072335.1 type I-E CRISPR-associated protein Cas6/Cse3/CasE [Pseudomonadota bacterium]